MTKSDEDFEELAAKLEFEANLPRREAEKRATQLLSGKFYMTQDGKVRARWTQAFQEKRGKEPLR